MPPLRVLVVADADGAEVTDDLLRRIEGTTFEPDFAASLSEVRARIASGAYDVYLIDDRLGTATDVALAVLEAHPHAPVIVLTGPDDRGRRPCDGAWNRRLPAPGRPRPAHARAIHPLPAHRAHCRRAAARVRGARPLARRRRQRADAGPVIPVAEETGLISSLGRLVLREACRQLAEWRVGGKAEQLTMAVNISGRQLFEPAFATQVEAALSDHGLTPDALRLEITETAAAADADAVRGALERLLAQTGVRAHLDDFGTGAASLTVLRGFPGDVLKIDRSFVLSMGSDEGCFQIVKAVVGLAHEMGMRVVAEGVECEWQLELLCELRCEYAQGFLLARPLTAAAAGALLATGLVTTA